MSDRNLNEGLTGEEERPMSEMKDGEVHIDEEDAQGGSKEGVVRWVLLISLLAAILLLSIIWIVGAIG